MSKYIEFPLEGGGAILIESPDEPSKAPTGLVPAARGESLKRWPSRPGSPSTPRSRTCASPPTCS